MHSLWQSILFLNQHSKQRHPRRQRLRFERLEDRRLLAGFSYEIADVPDFDQFRDVSRAEGISGLPGGGSNHCVPTSGINWAAFIASHGFPQVAPGPNAWQLGPPNHTNIYNAATDAIRALGDAMGTTAADGTTGSDGKNGLQAWLDTYAEDAFVVSRYSNTATYTPNLQEAANLANWGDLVNAAVGWYRPMRGYLNRNGGHMFSVVDIAIADIADPNSNREIGIHDPALDTGGATTQAPFTENTFGVAPNQAVYVDNGAVWERTLDYLPGRGSGGTVAAIDELVAIRPVYGLSAQTNIISVLYPYLLDHIDRAVETHLPAKGNVTDLAINPAGYTHPYLVEGSSTVWEIDALTGESVALAELPSDQLKHVVFGESNIYVVSDTEIYCLDRDGRLVSTARLPGQVDAIAYDATRDMLIMACGGCDSLYLLNRDLQSIGSVEVSLDASLRAEMNLAVASDGSLWVHQDGSAKVTRILLNRENQAETEVITLEGAVEPRGFSVDDGGNLFVTEGGQVNVFDTEGRPNRQSRFHGLRGGDSIDILRSVDWHHESTETRLYQNVTPQDVNEERVQIVPVDGQLFVMGTSADNQIRVTDHGNGTVQVVIDGFSREYEGIESIYVEGQGGADVVSILGRYTDDESTAEMEVELGAGDDALQLTIQDARIPRVGDQGSSQGIIIVGGSGQDDFKVSVEAAAPELGGSRQIIIVGGDGADDVSARVQSPANGSTTSIIIVGGKGDDQVAVQAAAGPNSQLHTEVRGGQGNDDISVVTDVQAVLGVQPEPFQPLNTLIAGGEGDDRITVLAEIDAVLGVDPEPFEPLRLTVRGGNGDDAISVLTDIKAVMGVEPEPFQPVEVTVRGGAGNDQISVVADVETVLGVEPEPFAPELGAIFNVRGGRGDDQINVVTEFTTTIAGERGAADTRETRRPSPLASELFVAGGEGDDVISLRMDGELVSHLNVRLTGGLGQDLISVVSTLDVTKQAQLMISGAGGKDEDLLFMALAGLIDGRLLADFGGGEGDDLLLALLAIQRDSLGFVEASLRGGLGDDFLAMFAHDPRPDGYNYQVDGGRGRDGCRVSENVVVSNCEAPPDAEGRGDRPSIAELAVALLYAADDEETDQDVASRFDAALEGWSES